MKRPLQRHASILGLCLSLAGTKTDASAQSRSADEVAADALFRQGKDLLDAGDYDRACAKFESSQALQPGLGTLLFLGDCYERAGRSASAFRTFEEATALAEKEGDPKRAKLSSVRAAALEPSLARLVIRVAAKNTSLSGFGVHVNGEAVPESRLGTRAPFDPGTQRIEVTAPEHERWEMEVKLPDGPSEVVVDVPPLTPVTKGMAQDDAAPPPKVTVKPSYPLAADASAPGHGQRLTGGWIAVIGLAGVGLGGYFGYDALKKNNASESPSHCPTLSQCFDSGVHLREEARQSATVADVAVGVGGALVLTGVVIYVLAPSEQSHSAGLYLTTRAQVGTTHWIVGGEF